MTQFTPAIEIGRISMNRIDADDGESRASTASAAGPCNASKARSSSTSIVQVSEQGVAQMPFIDVLAAGIDDKRQILAAVTDHQIVDDAAAAVGEKRIALPPRRKAQDIGRHDTFESPSGVGHPAGTRAQCDLPHMRDIEQAGGAAGMQVFLQHAQRIMDGHVVAGEQRHAGAHRQVERMERRLLTARIRSGPDAPSSHRPPAGARADLIKVERAPPVDRPKTNRQAMHTIGKIEFRHRAPHQLCAD